MTAKRTILYIEDDPASRRLVEMTLRHAGYKVLVAERGLEGIDIARREKPDLILTDINLPDLSGREITTMLRAEERFRNVPIIALTAQVFKEQRELAMAAGVNGYLTKPLDIEALPRQMEYYLSGGVDHIDQETLAEAQVRYIRDVVKRLEGRIRELENTNLSLRRLDKMKDTFIQLTGHELRTPLTLVYGYSRLLEDNPTIAALLHTDDQARALMVGLVDSIERMQDVINEVLTISRIMTNQIDLSLGVVEPAIVAEKAVRRYERALEDRHLKLTFDRAAWPQERVRADAELLELAFANLLSNAIKYTPDGGDIALTSACEEQQLQFTVRDSGIGIGKEELERIFERFYTTHDPLLHSTSKTAFRGGGLGLGLAICKGIVEAHSGHIWVTSTQGDGENSSGTEVTFTLPRMADSHK